MSPEALTIIGTGIALAALDVGLIAWLHSDMKQGYSRVEDRLLAVEKEQARTSGLLEGLGLTGRATPESAAGG